MPIRREKLKLIKRPKIINVLYGLAFLIALTDGLAGYVQSSFLINYFGDASMGLLMAVAAGLTLLAASFYPRLIDSLGNFKSSLFAFFIGITATFLISISQDPLIIAIAFIVRYIVLIMLVVNLDIFLEEQSDDANTGSIRGHYLLAINSAWLCSPLLAGYWVDHFGYVIIYQLGGALLSIAFLLLLSNYKLLHRSYWVKRHKPISWLQVFKSLKHQQDLRLIIISAFCLQIFYGWAVIYVPIYLHTVIGFSWSVLGVMFTVMLLPFVLFQLPAGLAADRLWGEKEMLVVGYLLMAGACLLIATTASTSLWLWGSIMFLSRSGAALAEAMQEVYFYKKVNAKNIGLITLFRQTRSLGWIFAGVIAFFVLKFLPLPYLFYLATIILILNIINLSPLKDTK
ncbi:hypothetical protein COT94_01060 [Candidatus Falkowbacteria bacterium CG10_big_fil_rev_8_21_14_0_10_37_14]|uniref:Major facilitator superfamily (MFS) profile domain-containing protein n=1 Tax=Candidatus Falkowbacteria bacterium CG10_big_fil_rev_8_21_14_0_10_37_14 TaxID=1974561 RepID=A0A2M6WTY9_9BACT|nr:MAG: hypothetical protein COT94_01060 [Candidatus Falkowbacteria bacterium CG10_big_fil_rev_8_21_14_0_10_37_14]